MTASRGERFLSHLTRSFRGLIILAFLAGCLVLPSRVSRAQTEDLEAQRRQIQQQQATIASQIDTLKATDAEIAIALAKLRENVVAQQARVELAQQASEVADRQVVASEQAVAATQADLDDLSAKLSKQAVGLYVRPQTDQVLSTFIPAKADSGSGELDSLEDRTRIRLHLDDVANLVAEVRVKKSDLQRAEAEAKRERTQAEKVRRSTEDALVELQHGLAQQNELAVAVAARIEQSKAEADKLSVQDSKLAAEIRSRQEELAARLAEERRLAAVAAAAVTADAARRSAVLVSVGEGQGYLTALTHNNQTTTTAISGSSTSASTSASVGNPSTSANPSASSGSTVKAPATTATTASSAERAAQRTSMPGAVRTAWVRGIEVAAEIAPAVEAMIAAAAADGVRLTGSGYRSTAEQISIRRSVCGPTDYDIWDKPSWECSPPVARPGYSMHERGLAIDFVVQDDLMRSQSNPAFLWLSQNAVKYGFYNLPSEPWHWSVNGR